MKNKTEIRLDKEFERIGVKIIIYHYTEVSPFNGITIATVNSPNQMIHYYTWKEIGNFIYECSKVAFEQEYNHTTQLLKELAQTYYIHGVSICNKRDQFNKQRGRIIAKGRLLKWLQRND